MREEEGKLGSTERREGEWENRQWKSRIQSIDRISTEEKGAHHTVATPYLRLVRTVVHSIVSTYFF
jgi:hypothetical protein